MDPLNDKQIIQACMNTFETYDRHAVERIQKSVDELYWGVLERLRNGKFKEVQVDDTHTTLEVTICHPEASHGFNTLTDPAIRGAWAKFLNAWFPVYRVSVAYHPGTVTFHIHNTLGLISEQRAQQEASDKLMGPVEREIEQEVDKAMKRNTEIVVLRTPV